MHHYIGSKVAQTSARNVKIYKICRAIYFPHFQLTSRQTLQFYQLNALSGCSCGFRSSCLDQNLYQTPYVVTCRNKTVVIARNKDGHVIERNVSHFKKIPKPNDTDDEDTLDEFEDSSQSNNECPLPEPVQLNPNNSNDNGVNMNPRRSTRVRKQPERVWTNFTFKHCRSYIKKNSLNSQYSIDKIVIIT